MLKSSQSFNRGFSIACQITTFYRDLTRLCTPEHANLEIVYFVCGIKTENKTSFRKKTYLVSEYINVPITSFTIQIIAIIFGRTYITQEFIIIIVSESFSFLFCFLRFYVFVEQYGVLLNPTIMCHIFSANSQFRARNFDMQKKLNVSLIQSTPLFSFNNFQVVKKTFHLCIRIQCAMTQLSKTKNIKGTKEYFQATYSTF